MAQADAGAGGLLQHGGAAGSLVAPRGDEVRRWRALCDAMEGADRHPWPDAEAHVLMTAVLASIVEGDESGIEPATRAWASSTVSMPVLVRRLGCLRELLADRGVLPVPVPAERLQRVLDKVTTLATEVALAELEDAALTDSLTGAGNRRALEAAARAALAASARTATPLSLAVIDLDGLKAINDTGGHAAGDEALARLSAALRAALRETDQLFRIGGDEFVTLLPLAPPDAVAHLMQRAERFDAPSFSWGVASAPADAVDLAGLLHIADTRLYAARRAAGYYDGGRVRVPAPMVSAPAMTASPPASPRHHHRPRRRSVVAAAMLSVAAVVGLALGVPGSHASPNGAPPGGPSSSTPPRPGSSGPGGSSSGLAGQTTPGPSGTAGGPSAGGSTPTGATSGPTGTTAPTSRSGAPPPPPPPSTTTPPPTTTTTAPGGVPLQPGVTLPPPPLGTSSTSGGSLLG